MPASSPSIFRIFILSCRMMMIFVCFKIQFFFLLIITEPWSSPSHRIKFVQVVLRLQSSCDSREVRFFMLGCRRQEGLDFLSIRTELFQGKFRSDACNRRQADLSLSPGSTTSCTGTIREGRCPYVSYDTVLHP